MKLVLDGREYDLTEAVQRPAIGDVVDLKRATKDLGEPVSVRKITDAIEDLGGVFLSIGDGGTVRDLGDAMLDYFDDIDHLLAFSAMVFLCRRKAGEPCTWEAALRVSPADVQLRVDVESVEDEADPKDPSTLEDGEPVEA